MAADDDDMLRRLAALEDSSKQLPDLIGQCSNFKFVPGALPLSISDENSTSGELLAETVQLIRELEDELDILGEEIKDGREENMTRLKESHDHLVKQLSNYRIAFRRAQITARANLLAAVHKERQLVMSAYTDPEPESEHEPEAADTNESSRPTTDRNTSSLLQRQTALSDEDQQTVGASTDVTLALRRTHDLIAAELARSEYAHQTLVESSQALAQLNESYGSLEGMLASSRDLLGTLVRSQKSDTWYLQTSMYMLLGTLAWLVFRRFLYGPVWWLVWLPLRLVFGTGWMVGKAVVPVGRGQTKVGEVADGEGQVGVRVDGLPGDELPTIAVVDEAKKSPVAEKEVEESLGTETEVEGNLGAEKEVKEKQVFKEKTVSEEVGAIIDGTAQVAEATVDEVALDSDMPEPVESTKQAIGASEETLDEIPEHTAEELHEKDEL